MREPWQLWQQITKHLKLVNFHDSERERERARESYGHIINDNDIYLYIYIHIYIYILHCVPLVISPGNYVLQHATSI